MKHREEPAISFHFLKPWLVEEHEYFSPAFMIYYDKEYVSLNESVTFLFETEFKYPSWDMKDKNVYMEIDILGYETMEKDLHTLLESMDEREGQYNWIQSWVYKLSDVFEGTAQFCPCFFAEKQLSTLFINLFSCPLQIVKGEGTHMVVERFAQDELYTDRGWMQNFFCGRDDLNLENEVLNKRLNDVNKIMQVEKMDLALEYAYKIVVQPTTDRL